MHQVNISNLMCIFGVSLSVLDTLGVLLSHFIKQDKRLQLHHATEPSVRFVKLRCAYCGTYCQIAAAGGKSEFIFPYLNSVNEIL